MATITDRASAPAARSAGAPRKTAVVIGAGAAGLATGKALADRGIDFDWFEAGSMVGGLWQIDNDNGGAAAYDSLHLNSSRPLTEFPSYPMPQDWPDYPRHTLVAEYFESFADVFGLRERIAFNTAVTSVDPIPGGAWSVTTSDGATREYQHVLVASGHHTVPRIPQFEGSFTGQTMHSHDYRSTDALRDKRVLVIGVGNSGMDIACDSSRVSVTTLLSTRHGVHVLPKYALGKPIDQWSNPYLSRLPFEVERRLDEALLRLAVGTPEHRGMPKPDHRLLSAHPTVSAELLDRVGHGDIVMKPDIERFDGNSVRFVDGTVEQLDLVVFATGYQITFPFLTRDLIDPTDNQLRLYQRVVDPELPGLWFMGFIQSVGSGISLVDYQAQWVGDLLAGECELPSKAAMRHWIDNDTAALAKRYVRSSRHTIQVDYWRYIRALQGERARKTAAGRSLLGRLRALSPV